MSHTVNSGSMSAGSGKNNIKFYFTVTYADTKSGTKVTAKCHVRDKGDNVKSAYCTVSGGGLSRKRKAAMRGHIKGRSDEQTRTICSFMVRAPKVPKIKMSFHGKHHTFSERNTTEKMLAPTSVKATVKNDAKIDIKVNWDYRKLPVLTPDKLIVERCVDVYDKNSFTAIPNSPFTITSDDRKHRNKTVSDQSSEVDRGKRFWYRAKLKNDDTGKMSGYELSSNSSYTTPNSDVITTGPTAVKATDTSITVSWAVNSIQTINNKLLSSFNVYRSTDAGSYEMIGTVKADDQHVQYSYLDTNLEPDHTYTYRLTTIANGSESETCSNETEDIYTNPASPVSVTAAQNSSSDVVLSISGTSNIATHVQIQRSIDSGEYTQIAEEDYPLETYTDEDVTATDTIIYRVRYKCDSSGTLYSAYVVSNAVEQKIKPSAPVLKSPVSGSKITNDRDSVSLVFQHKSNDGSSQEDAELQYKINNGEWETVTDLETASSYTLDITEMAVNDVIHWKARTKGAHSSYSDWSAESTFTITARPQIVFTSPDNGESIEELPLVLGWTYTDTAGTLSSLTLQIKEEDEVKREIDVPTGTGASGDYTYTITDYLFETETQYGLSVIAESTSGFQTAANIVIEMNYEETEIEGGLVPFVEFDDNGIATVTVSREITEEEGEEPTPAAISHCYLYRIYDGDKTLIATDPDEGMEIEDDYAPLNRSFSYKLMMITSGGTIGIAEAEGYQESNEWMIYYDGGIARAVWNPSADVSLSKPERQEVRYSGRKYPVSYDSIAREEKCSFSTVILDREELDNFREMMRNGGRGIWKSGDGDVYDANFEFSYSSEFKGSPRWDAKLSVTRTEAD